MKIQLTPQMLAKAQQYLLEARNALIKETAAAPGKARIHSKTLSDVMDVMERLEAIAAAEVPAIIPQAEKPKGKGKSKTKED